MGIDPDAYAGRPVIGIANSWSQLNNCNSNLRELAAAVSRGVLAAGGLPLEFPTLSLGRRVHEALGHALSQPDGDGGRRDAAGQPDRRRRALVQLRQNHAGPADGGRQRRFAGHSAQRRAADIGPLARHRGRNRHRSVEILGRTAGGSHQRSGFSRTRGLLRLLGRRVQHDGDGLDDDGPLRSSGHDAAGHVVDSRDRRPPGGRCGSRRPPHCRARGRRFASLANSHVRPRSTTPSARCTRWAVRPTR